MSEQDKPIRKTWVMLKRAYNGIALSSLPIGTLIKDENTTFLGKPIIWKVADMNHEGYPQNSITLMSDKLLAARPFDAPEPKNNTGGRQSYGNNRYSVSNVRQWLNSDAEAGMWYTPQHSLDQAPNNLKNSYEEDAGFLNTFSNDFKNALLDTTLTTLVHSINNVGTHETTTDKIFLVSGAEIGASKIANTLEGNKLQIFENAGWGAYPTAEMVADSEYKHSTALLPTKTWHWWLRTPYTSSGLSSIGPSHGYYVSNLLSADNGGVYQNQMGIRPFCNISLFTRVSETPDENGVYTIVQF